MNRLHALTFVALVTASGALAHSGVKNAAVKARMDAMADIAAEMKILGTMARGQFAFDPQAARAAVANIADHAAATPGLFQTEEHDPKSEAKLSIWANFDDFTAKATELESVARGLSVGVESAADLVPAMATLGATCKSCHAEYRQ